MGENPTLQNKLLGEKDGERCEPGLSDEEIAFYDALADNESACNLMGEPSLRVIAHELVESTQENVTVDWMHREARLCAHARPR